MLKGVPILFSPTAKSLHQRIETTPHKHLPTIIAEIKNNEGKIMQYKKRVERRVVVSRSGTARKKPSPRSSPVSDASCVPICLYIPIDPLSAPSPLCHPTVVPLSPGPPRSLQGPIYIAFVPP